MLNRRIPLKYINEYLNDFYHSPHPMYRSTMLMTNRHLFGGRLRHESKLVRIRNRIRAKIRDKTKNRSHVAIYSICLMVSMVGLLYQSTEISVLYFSRQISSDLTISIPHRFKLPALRMCTQQIGSTQPLVARKFLDIIPSVEQMMISCKLRAHRSYLIEKLNTSSDCVQKLFMVKFTIQHFTCIHFGMKLDFMQSYHLVKHSPQNAGLLLEVVLDSSYFVNVSTMEIAFTDNQWPPTSTPFSVLVSRDIQNPMSTYVFLWSKYINQLLPPPYPTNCLNYTNNGEQWSQDLCVQRCITNHTKSQLNRAPFTRIIANDSSDIDYRIVSISDLENKTFAGKLSAIERKCLNSPTCIRSNCYEELAMSQFVADKKSEHFKIRIYAPQDPDFVTTYYPKLNLVEYLVYLSSCVGLWLGWSMMDIAKVFDTLCALLRA